jgi:DNA-binding NtrC family response regulator
VSASLQNAAAPLVLLLVEDEPMLRQVVALTLKVEGFVVVEAEDGTAGLEILRSDKAIDVLLTDVRMPGLNGYQLAVSALTMRPRMPVILMTGYADDEMPDAIREAEIPIIRKPFNFAKLGGSIREIVAKRA